MTRRQVLLLTYHFPPSAGSGTFRMLGFARHLPGFDWDVHVIAPPQMPWDPVDHALSAQVPAGTAYDAVPYPRRMPRLLRWFAPYAVWLPAAWRACQRTLRKRRADIVLTSGPPHVIHLLGVALKRMERLPWVADFRDPWISGMPHRSSRPGQLWQRFLEKRVFADADRILANATNARRLFVRTYPRHAGKITTLTNGFDPPAPFANPPRTAGALQMLHAGEIYAGRDPLPLLDAMAQLKQTGLRTRFDVMGHVHLPSGDLVTEATRRGLAAEVRLRGQLPYQEALQEMAQSDLLVVLDGPGRTIGVPAKVYEYFGAGRPVLALVEPDGDAAEILRASGIVHRVAPPRDVERIRQAIAELASMPPTAPDPERLRRFTRASLAGDLAGIMDQVVAKPAADRRQGYARSG
jgi:glycosyltransferase involved in cell wall biosynthesis